VTLSSSFGGPARGGVPPLEVRLLRDGIPESRHRVHAVVCDGRGRVLMRAGDPQQLSFARSALKPFQASVFVSSGAADHCNCGERGLAIACASHAGTAIHANPTHQAPVKGFATIERAALLNLEGTTLIGVSHQPCRSTSNVALDMHVN